MHMVMIMEDHGMLSKKPLGLWPNSNCRPGRPAVGRFQVRSVDPEIPNLEVDSWELKK